MCVSVSRAIPYVNQSHAQGMNNAAVRVNILENFSTCLLKFDSKACQILQSL